MIKQRLLFYSLILLLGCNPFENFYSSYSREDLWRIPLRKPYELLTPGMDSTDTKFWHLQFQYNNFKGYINHINVTKINVSNNYIYGHGQDIPDISPNNYFLIIVDSKKEIVFDSFENWETELKKYNLKSTVLYNPWSLFFPFKEKGILPWN